MRSKFFKSNAWMWIMSFLISIALWIFVVVVQNPQTVITIRDVPVIFSNYTTLSDQELIVLDDSTVTTNVKVQGTRRLLADLNNQVVKATIDLSTINAAGEYFLPIDIHLPYDGLTLVDKTISNVTINVDHMVEREVALVPLVEGTPADGFVSHTESVFPQTVRVKAPQSIMQLIDKAVVKVNVDGANDDTSVTDNVSFISANGIPIEDKNITANPATGTAKSIILRKKRVPIVPILQGTPPAGRTTTGSALGYSEIEILGDPAVIDAIQFINTEPVDIAKMNTTNQKELALDIPAGVILEPDIKKVTVNIEVKVSQ